MATEDLKSFIETRLNVLIPGVDLSNGSPAQTQFVQPLIDYLGTDPFSTDIKSFIQDRFLQEFPEIHGGDPGVINDTIVNPLIMLLEPFKREMTAVKVGQSLGNPSTLSDTAADALGANWYDYRSTGGASRGIARIYFSSPVTQTIQVTARCYTSSGLNFYPVQSVGITAEEMVFNKQGSLYYVDVLVQAENPGTEYNIGPEELAGVDGVFGYIKITNLQKFENGSPRVSTPEFIGNMKQALNERSLVTRRGATARILDVFRTSVRSVQQVGATDVEMQRDILMAVGPGHAWMTGEVGIYGNVALARMSTLDDSSATPTVSVGDSLYIYLDKYSYSGQWLWLDQSRRFIRYSVEEVLCGPVDESIDPFQVAFLLRVSGTPDAGLGIPDPVYLRGGLIKKSAIVVSSVEGAENSPVESGGIHVYGRSDIYVKPMIQDQSTSAISSVIDDPAKSLFKLQGNNLETFGELPLSENKVHYAGNFEQSGVLVGDTIVIESGSDAGSYRLIKVDGEDAYLSKDLTKTETDIRFSIVRSLSINPFSVRKLKAPFAGSTNNDLQTFIGSTTVRVTNPGANVIDLGAELEDTLEILDGPDAGAYLIKGFKSDGTEMYLDRALSSSSSGLTYEIYTRLGALDLPLLRIKKIDLLDSSQQPIGITIPPADPVAVLPVASMTSARVRGYSQSKSGMVLPKLIGGAGANEAAPSGDRRYSLGIDPTNGGTYRSMVFANGTYAEFLFPSDAATANSYFLAVAEDSAQSENFPPIDPKSGDVFTIKNGPNKGSYLIESVYKFRHADSGGKLYWSYFIKIYGEFPVDVIGSIITFLDDVGVSTAALKPSANPGDIPYPSFFESGYSSLGTLLDTALTTVLGVSSPGATVLQDMVASLYEVDYEWGDPARGTLRTFVQEPTLFELNTAQSTSPTLFDLRSGDGGTLTFRADPNRYERHTVIPGKEEAEADYSAYPRDYSQSATTVSLDISSGINPLNAGVMEGDTLEVYPEVLFHFNNQALARQTGFITTAGSNKVVVPAASYTDPSYNGVILTKDRVGDLFFIDEGKDKGAYRVVEFISPTTLALDRTLTRTTPTIVAGGRVAQWGYNGAENVIVSDTPDFSIAHIGKYATLYGCDVDYQGSYEIISIIDAYTAEVDRPTNFPALAADPYARWVVTEADEAPAQTSNGTELVGLQPARLYSDVPVSIPITAISAIVSDRTLTTTTSRTSYLKQKEPYRVYRGNIRRVTPSEILLNRDGPFYYFDTDVVSLGPSAAFNIDKSSYLTMRQGTFMSLGYRHRVDDSTLTYSIRETGALDFSTKVLPIGYPDTEDSMVPVSRAPIQITYERAAVVADVQTFASSAEDHVSSADILVRHFLPSYVSYEASYAGGSSPSVIAEDIIQLISELGIEATIDVSEIQRVIENRGGNPETPTKVYLLVHDWNRRQLAEMSENAVYMSNLSVPYSGTARVVSFTPGPDVSGQEELPYGEKINLTRF